MDTKNLSSSSKDQNIPTTDQSNDPTSCKAENEISIKTDMIENNKLKAKETQHCNSEPKAELTRKPAFGHQLNNTNICVDYQHRTKVKTDLPGCKAQQKDSVITDPNLNNQHAKKDNHHKSFVSEAEFEKRTASNELLSNNSSATQSYKESVNHNKMAQPHQSVQQLDFDNCNAQQAGFFPQQTSYLVQNDSGYESFTTQLNNDSFYSSHVGNQQSGYHMHLNHPYDNTGLSNNQYPGQQQPQMMPLQNNSQLSRQHATFQSQYDGPNASFQYKGRPMASVKNYNHGSFQQQFHSQPQQLSVPQQTNNHKYAYHQYASSNQVSSYPGQGNYTGCYKVQKYSTYPASGHGVKQLDSLTTDDRRRLMLARKPIKHRKQRLTLTEYQKSTLENFYQRTTKYPLIDQIDNLERCTRLTSREIKTWFKNRRSKSRSEGEEITK